MIAALDRAAVKGCRGERFEETFGDVGCRDLFRPVLPGEDEAAHVQSRVAADILEGRVLFEPILQVEC